MIGISLSMISAVNAPIEVLNVAVGLAILKEKEEGTWMRRSSARKPAATDTEAQGRRGAPRERSWKTTALEQNGTRKKKTNRLGEVIRASTSSARLEQPTLSPFSSFTLK